MEPDVTLREDVSSQSSRKRYIDLKKTEVLRTRESAIQLASADLGLDRAE